MTNVQLYFAIGLPVITILAGFTINVIAVLGIQGDIREIRSDIKIIMSKLADFDTRLSVLDERIKLRT